MSEDECRMNVRVKRSAMKTLTKKQKSHGVNVEHMRMVAGYKHWQPTVQGCIEKVAGEARTCKSVTMLLWASVGRMAR